MTGLAQAFASRDVLGAGGSTLVVTGYTVNDGDGGKDYTVTTQTAPGTITPAALIITATSDTRVYDGTTVSSQSGTSYHDTRGGYGGDTVSGLIQAFLSKGVLGAGGSTLVVTGYTVNDGDGGKDYTVVTRNRPRGHHARVADDRRRSCDMARSTTARPPRPETPTPGRRSYARGHRDGTGPGVHLQGRGSRRTAARSWSTGYNVVNDGDGGKDYMVTTQARLRDLSRSLR